MVHDEVFSSRVIQISRELPLEYQQAILWILEHYDYAEFLINGKHISVEKLNEYIEYAKTHNDYLLHILLLFKKSLNNLPIE